MLSVQEVRFAIGSRSVAGHPVSAGCRVAKVPASVWRRTGGMCGLCGRPVELREMEIDHVIPIAQGGTHALSNLQPAHGECNRRKGAGRRRSTVLRPAMTATPMRAASPSQLLPYPRAEQDTLTVRQVAALLRFDPETVRRWLRKGLLRGAAGPKGAGYRIARSELERVLAEHRLQAATEACVA